MTFEQKEGNGVLFKNDKKSDNSPDYKGNIMIAGNLYDLSAWIKEGKKGKFMSLSAQVKGAYQKSIPVKTESKPALPNAFADFDNDIPF